MRRDQATKEYCRHGYLQIQILALGGGKKKAILIRWVIRFF
jgi:hypothetical protein